MTREEAIQHHIDEIMDSWDVDKCVKVMKLLRWKWHDIEEMDIYEFRKGLRNALRCAVAEGGYASGGFEFRFHDSVDEETGEPFIYISGGFVIEGCTSIDGTTYSKEQ